MKCRGRLLDLAVSLDGAQRVTIEIEGDMRDTWDALHGRDVSVEVKAFHRRRSLDANAYCWVLVDKIAETIAVRKSEVYREAIREIGGVSDTVCVRDQAVERMRENWQRQGLGWQAETAPSKLEGCTNMILYYGSSVYDSRQMSQLIDVLVRECQALGIETMPPAELNALVAAWGEKEDKTEHEQSGTDGQAGARS